MKPSRFFILSNLIYIPLSCYLFWEYNYEIEPLIYVLVHFFLASVTNCILYKKVIQNNICLISSPTASFLVITQVYITFSSLKYFVDSNQFYPMFELTKTDQFVGSLLGFTVIFLILFSLEKSFYVSPPKFIDWVNSNTKLILFISMLLLIVSFFTKMFLFNHGYGSTYSNSIFTKLELKDRGDAIYFNINEIVDQILTIYFCLLYQIYKLNSVKKFLRFNFLFIIICIFIYNLYFFKSRLMILFLVLVVISIVQAFQLKKGMNYLAMLLIFLPASIGILPLFNSLLGRENLITDSYDLLIQITSCRADVTDYAFAILKKSNYMGLNPDILFQGILNAIPNLIFPGKDLVVQDAYTIALDKIGWQSKTETSIEIVDYQDSLFSSGAMGFGILGFLFVPIIYVRILNYSALFFTKFLKNVSIPIIIFPLICSSYKIELEFSNIFINMRNSYQMIFILLFIYLFYKSIVKKKLIGLNKL